MTDHTPSHAEGRRDLPLEPARSRGSTGGRRVALLGTGYIAEFHARALELTRGVELSAVCDTSHRRAEAFAASFGVSAVYTSFNDMLRRERLDAAHVLTPPDAHFDPGRQLLEAGVATFLEKPMTPSLEQAARLMALSGERGVPLGVAHNFLFAEPYEKLRNAVQQNVFGPLDYVGITWHKPLGQLVAGPFDAWMLRSPTNILFETGPHPFGVLLDLVGVPEELQVMPSDEQVLPTGVRFFRRWHVYARRGRSVVDVNISFARGFSEHSVHVRGVTGAASVDFERNVYVHHRHSPREMDFDRYAMLRNESRETMAQARRTLAGYVASKLRPSARSNPYRYSIVKAVNAFHQTDSAIDARLSPVMGRDIIALCERVRSLIPEPRRGASVPVPARANSESPVRSRVLLLGATGFIGRETLRCLASQTIATRVLVRSAAKVPSDLARTGVQVVEGDCADVRALDLALDGVEVVIHLARSNVKTWAEYQRHEIDMTRQIAERALAKHVRRFIYSGTIDSYYAGPGAATITEETPLDPHISGRNLYARAKAASEEVLFALHRDRALPLVVIRPGIVIGSGGSPFHWGVGMWQHDSICQVWGAGDNPLPFVLVDDVAAALLAAVDAPPTIDGQSYNLVGDACLSANEYLDELERCAGLKIQRLHTPIAVFYGISVFKWLVKVAVRHPEHIMPTYRDWASRTQKAAFCNAKAKNDLGWRPEADRDRFVARGVASAVRESFQ